MTIIQAQPLKTYGIFGPAFSIDNEVPVFDGTSGKKIKAGSGLINPSAGRIDLAEVRAKDGDGLKLYDDGGSGIFIADGGNVTIEKDLTVTGVNSIIEDGSAQGQMSFWNGTKWVKTETSELFWDDVNKRFGVGTDSPTEKLTVNGKLRLLTGTDYADISAQSTGSLYFQPKNGRTYFNGVGARNQFYAYDYSVATPHPYLRLNSREFDLNTGDNPAYGKLSFQCDGASYVDAPGDNFGIGTRTPGEKLHIGGGAVLLDNGHWYKTKLSGGVKVRNFGTGEDDIAYFGGIDTAQTEARFKTGGINRMTIVSNGRIGIGTTTPAISAKLEILSTTGALLLPRMTTAQKDALTAINGMFLYDSTLNQTQTYENGAWRQV